jgi:hypothetical protein
MNLTNRYKHLLALMSFAAAAVFSLPAQSHPILIDFEDVADNTGVGKTYISQAGSVASQGFIITETTGYLWSSFAYIHDNYSHQDGLIFSGNGTKRLVTANSAAFSIAAANGQPFDLYSIDGGESIIELVDFPGHHWATALQVVGRTVGGTSTTQIMELDLIKDPFSGLQTFILNETFKNLISVTISGIGGNPEFTLDNISVVAREESTVPEPESIMLFSLGLIGVMLTGRFATKR